MPERLGPSPDAGAEKQQKKPVNKTEIASLIRHVGFEDLDREAQAIEKITSLGIGESYVIDEVEDFPITIVRKGQDEFSYEDPNGLFNG